MRRLRSLVPVSLSRCGSCTAGAGRGYLGHPRGENLSRSECGAHRRRRRPRARLAESPTWQTRFGKDSEVGAKRPSCSGGVLTAGFQNSHVHFIEPRWEDAAHKPAAELQQSSRGHADAVRFHHRVRHRLGPGQHRRVTRPRGEGRDSWPAHFHRGARRCFRPTAFRVTSMIFRRGCWLACISRAPRKRPGPRSAQTSPPAPMAPSCSCTPRRVRA